MALPARPGRAIGLSSAVPAGNVWTLRLPAPEIVVERRRTVLSSVTGGWGQAAGERTGERRAQDCGVKAFMASLNAARLASQARRGEVSSSSYGWAPSWVSSRATSSSTCSLPVPGRA